jgi:hypothetical protein
MSCTGWPELGCLPVEYRQEPGAELGCLSAGHRRRTSIKIGCLPAGHRTGTSSRTGCLKFDRQRTGTSNRTECLPAKQRKGTSGNTAGLPASWVEKRSQQQNCAARQLVTVEESAAELGACQLGTDHNQQQTGLPAS